MLIGSPAFSLFENFFFSFLQARTHCFRRQIEQKLCLDPPKSNLSHADIHFH